MSFAKDFFWGGSVSSMQTEGAAFEGGKGPSVYNNIDTALGHTDTWNTAIDTYNRFAEDNSLYKEMGFNCFRFSIDWSRIMPSGEGEVNEEGLKFYDRYLDDLIAKGIKPLVCLNHFDLPYELYKKYGGWSSRKTYEAFVAYAEVIIKHFGNKIPMYFAINEQNAAISIAMNDYTEYEDEHDRKRKEAAVFLHHYLASAATNALVRKYAPDSIVGGMITYRPFYPETCKPDDALSADIFNEKHNYRHLSIFASGQLPSELLSEWEEIGFGPTAEDVELLAGAKMDFLALSYYCSGVSTAEHPYEDVKNPYLQETEFGWKIDPVGIRIAVRQIFNRYQLPVFMIECGIGVNEAPDGKSPDYIISDDYRIEYLRNHFTELKKAVDEDHVELMGILVWGPIDILSSQGTMKKRYGFIYVNRTDEQLLDLKRSPKKSFYWMKHVIAVNGESFE